MRGRPATRNAATAEASMTSDVAERPISQATGWYAALAPEGKRTFWACFGGWALDAMDVQIFSFVIPAIIIAFCGHQCRCRPDRNGDVTHVGIWRLVRGCTGRPVWPGSHATDHDPLVRLLHVALRLRAELYATPGLPSVDGTWFRWRMGGGRRPDGRSDSSAAPRQGGRQRTERLGNWVGGRCGNGDPVFLCPATGHRLARLVLGRRGAGVLPVLCAPLRRRT